MPTGDTAGVPSLPAGRRCHPLGARLAGVEAVQSAGPALQPGIGWTVELFVDGRVRRPAGRRWPAPAVRRWRW